MLNKLACYENGLENGCIPDVTDAVNNSGVDTIDCHENLLVACTTDDSLSPKFPTTEFHGNLGHVDYVIAQNGVDASLQILSNRQLAATAVNVQTPLIPSVALSFSIYAV